MSKQKGSQKKATDKKINLFNIKEQISSRLEQEYSQVKIKAELQAEQNKIKEQIRGADQDKWTQIQEKIAHNKASIEKLQEKLAPLQKKQKELDKLNRNLERNFYKNCFVQHL